MKFVEVVPMFIDIEHKCITFVETSNMDFQTLIAYSTLWSMEDGMWNKNFVEFSTCDIGSSNTRWKSIVDLIMGVGTEYIHIIQRSVSFEERYTPENKLTSKL